MKNLKITDVKAAVVAGNFDWTLARIDTDAGISGYGETRQHIRDTMMTYVSSKDLILRLKTFLLGEDPTDIEPIMRKIRRFGGYSRQGGGVSAIETALWDILGKATGAPIYKLLGGKCRDKVRIYCDCHSGTVVYDSKRDYQLNDHDYTLEAYVENARAMKELGFTFLKFDLFPPIAGLVSGGSYGEYITSKGIDHLASIAAAIKECIGNDIELAFDCRLFPKVEDAIRFGEAVESLNLAFLEDLVEDSDVEGILRITNALSTPTLLGENLYLMEGFKSLIEARAISIAAPDVSTVGGIGEMKKIADYTKLYGIQMAPHCACSPIGMMATVHAAATMSNLVAAEFHAVNISFWDDLVKGYDGKIVRDGYITVPERPGLGIDVDEEQIRAHLKPGETLFE
jgi:L-alanine-DL-glutamate epimerase-like enolase superfamily enzyme